MGEANQIFFGFLQEDIRNPLPPLPLAGFFFSLGWPQKGLPDCTARLAFPASISQ
jgi:hypothetical protein